ncbi:MAG: ABC transporter permease subunit, partial [Candidatus Dormibacteraeota bacterium]|nr:ABC transporter permease subunit [Candidatus Dormibacteraeota bacterium]
MTGVCVLLGYPYAYFMASTRGRLRLLLLGVVVVSALTSLLVRSYSWVVILQQHGPLEDAFKAVGIPGVTLTGTTSGVVIALAQILLPLMILPLYAAMRRFDLTLLRAAQSLGSRPLMTFWRVYLPLTLPALLAGCLLVFVITLGFYVTPTLVGSSNHSLVSQIIVTEVSRLLAWGHAGALSLVFVVVTILFVGFVARVFRRGQEELVQGGRSPLSYGSDTVFTSLGLRVAISVLVTLVSVVLIAPVIVVVLLSFTGGQTFEFPPPSWSFQWYTEFFTNPAWTNALTESIKVGILATLLATVLGTAAAFGLDRSNFPGKTLINGLLIAPLLVPLVIVAVGVYAVFLQWNLVGTTFG